MAFDKDEWFQTVWNSHRDDSKPSPMLVGYIADELATLHAEIAALKARLPEPEREERVTGWAVKNRNGGLYTRVAGFDVSAGALNVLWFPGKKAAGVLVGALGYGEPVLLYKDTLKEVDDAV